MRKTRRRGVTEFEGLYFLGMPWLHSRKSGILFGVGDDAAYLAEQIAAREIVPVPVWSEAQRIGLAL
jgi:hypothetical protein